MSEKFNYYKDLNLPAMTVRAIGASLVIQGGLIIGLHPQQSFNAISSLVSRTPDCSEIDIKDSFFGTIAVFGAGTKVENGIVQPNSYQDKRLKAAAVALAKGYSSNIVLISGREPVLKSSSFIINSYLNKIAPGKYFSDV